MPLTLMLLLPFTYNQWDTKLCFFAQKNYFSVDTFLPDLEYLPWNTTDIYSEPNDALSQRYSLFKSVLDSQASLEKCCVKREFMVHGSINSEIQGKIATQNHLHRKVIMVLHVIEWFILQYLLS